MYQLKKIQRLPVTIDKAWDFFSSPKNLATITPPELGFEIKSELPDEMYEGAMISYTVKPLLGIPVSWVTEITHIRNKEYFVDEQRIGPYKIWHHQHWFKEIPGGIEMTDIIDYELPFPLISQLFHKSIVRKKLDHIFTFRQNKMVELFGNYEL